MANGTQYPWIPSDLSSLDFQGNCTIPSTWLAELVKTKSPALGDYPLGWTLLALSQGYNKYWKEHNVSHPENRALLDWFYTESFTNQNSTITEVLGNYTLDNCKNEFCRAIPWQGNSDQAGRGMYATYALEAALVTLYVSALLLNGKSSAPAAPARRSHFMGSIFHRSRDAFRESLRVFLDAALIFSASMLIAAIIDFSVTLGQSNKASTQSSVVLSGFVSLFSVFPAVALHSSASEQLRRSKFRNWGWATIGALTIAMFVLELLTTWKNVERSQDDPDKVTLEDQEAQWTWEQICLDWPALNELNYAFVSFFSILAAAVFLYLVFVSLIHLPALKKRRKTPSVRSAWNKGAAILSLLTMWAAFGVFVYYRKKISGAAGDTDEDHDWTFGQVLALATFAPVIIEFGMVLRKGPQRALTGLMSDRWRACKDEDECLPVQEEKDGRSHEVSD